MLPPQCGAVFFGLKLPTCVKNYYCVSAVVKQNDFFYHNKGFEKSQSRRKKFLTA